MTELAVPWYTTFPSRETIKRNAKHTKTIKAFKTKRKKINQKNEPGRIRIVLQKVSRGWKKLGVDRIDHFL